MPNIIEIVQPASVSVVEVAVPGVQGPPGEDAPNTIAVGPVNTLAGPGLWIETDGDDITFWIEDGE